MRLEKTLTLLVSYALALVAANAAAQPDPLGHSRPSPDAARVAASPAAASAVKTANFRDLASKLTTLKQQGAAKLTNYAPRQAAPHRLPNGMNTFRANVRASMDRRAPGTVTAIAGALPVQGGVLAPRTAVTPPPVGGFAGLSTADNLSAFGTEYEPPDQGLAVNNGKVLEATNLQIQLYDAASGNPSLAFDQGNFATAVPLPTFFDDPGVFSDPQVFFDPTLSAPTDTTAAAKGRWIVTVISYADSWSWDGSQWVPTNPNNYYIDMAVSATSDASGNWSIYRIRTFSDDLPGCGGIDCLPDYPKMGFDANGFFISVNLFGSGFVGAATYVMPKARMRDALAINFVRFFYVDPLNSYPSFLVQPSIPAPGQAPSSAHGGTEFLLEARKLMDGTNRIRVWAIENTSLLVADAPCSPTPVSGICGMTARFADVATPSSPGTTAVPTPGYYAGYPFNAQQPNQPGPNSASLQGYAPDIDGGYGGFSATIQYANNKLYGVLATANAYDPGSPAPNTVPGNLLSWYTISPSVNSTSGVLSATLSAKGTIVPPAGYFLQYPAFALLKNGAGVIGFSITNPNLNVPGNFPSTGYVKFSGSSTSGNLVVTGQGVAADDGFTAWYFNYHYGYDFVGRWGDYGAAVVDPFTASSTPTYYTGNEMIAYPFTRYSNSFYANWSTFISVIH